MLIPGLEIGTEVTFSSEYLVRNFIGIPKSIRGTIVEMAVNERYDYKVDWVIDGQPINLPHKGEDIIKHPNPTPVSGNSTLKINEDTLSI